MDTMCTVQHKLKWIIVKAAALDIHVNRAGNNFESFSLGPFTN